MSKDQMGGLCVLTLHVDDILLARNNLEMVKSY